MNTRFQDCSLQDSSGQTQLISEYLKKGPLMLVFYPGDFTPVCTKQLCGYRDGYEDFKKLGVQIVGISPDAPQKHKEFIQAMGFPFELLSDPELKAFKAYGMTFLFGMAGRGNVLISQAGEILYSHNELVPLTHRKKEELLQEFAHILKTP